jgi:hypothetical protein
VLVTQYFDGHTYTENIEMASLQDFKNQFSEAAIFNRGVVNHKIDLDWLMRVRVVIARCGEMDANKWWNTNGQLGPLGAKVLRRGFPRTHYFAQARSVFAVATHRCAQVFDPPNSATLWRLTDAIEDEFDAKWEGWIDQDTKWAPFFEAVADIKSFEIPALLEQFKFVTGADVAEAQTLKRSAEGKAVQIPRVFSAQQHDVTLLALGFGKGTKGELSVPYARLDGA